MSLGMTNSDYTNGEHPEKDEYTPVSNAAERRQEAIKPEPETGQATYLTEENMIKIITLQQKQVLLLTQALEQTVKGTFPRKLVADAGKIGKQLKDIMDLT